MQEELEWKERLEEFSFFQNDLLTIQPPSRLRRVYLARYIFYSLCPGEWTKYFFYHLTFPVFHFLLTFLLLLSVRKQVFSLFKSTKIDFY